MAPKRDRGKTFLLDQIDPALWLKVKARAEKEGRSVRWVILEMLKRYVREGVDGPTSR